MSTYVLNAFAFIISSNIEYEPQRSRGSSPLIADNTHRYCILSTSSRTRWKCLRKDQAYELRRSATKPSCRIHCQRELPEPYDGVNLPAPGRSTERNAKPPCLELSSFLFLYPVESRARINSWRHHHSACAVTMRTTSLYAVQESKPRRCWELPNGIIWTY